MIKEVKETQHIFALLGIHNMISLLKYPMDPAVDKPVYLCLPNIFKMNLFTEVFFSHHDTPSFIQIFIEYLLLRSRFSRVQLCVTTETAARQAPPSLGFSRQEHCSGLPFPSPMHQSEK